MSEIILSIRPEFTDKIVKREKNHEFRNYLPKQNVDKIWIYVPRPVCELKYIASVGNPVIYPGKITEDGFGNKEFNEGKKVSKYAFPILHLYEINEVISLARLRMDFNFSPPQNYVYTSKYPKLIQFVQSQILKQLF